MNFDYTVIVTGGRCNRFLSEDLIHRAMDELQGFYPAARFRIIHGDAFGTDRVAAKWAYARGLAVQPVPIDSRFDGEAQDAPFKRNERMARDFPPNICIGFPGSNGTLHMLRTANALPNCTVYDVEVSELTGNMAYSINRWPKQKT